MVVFVSQAVQTADGTAGRKHDETNEKDPATNERRQAEGAVDFVVLTEN